MIMPGVKQQTRVYQNEDSSNTLNYCLVDFNTIRRNGKGNASFLPRDGHCLERRISNQLPRLFTFVDIRPQHYGSNFFD